MALTSLKIGSTELHVPGTSGVARETIYALTALPPAEPRLVQMAGRYPASVGQVAVGRTVPLVVHFFSGSEDTRRAAWLSLMTLLDSSAGLISISWIDGATTKRFWCHATDAVADSQYTVGVATLFAPNPVAETV